MTEVNLGGRPREHDRDKIALDLIEWAKLPDSINLCKFCAINNIQPANITHWSNDDNKFRQAVELAKAYLGYRREELLNSNKLHVKCYDLNSSTYDYFLKEERRIQSEYASYLKTQENASEAPKTSIYVTNESALDNTVKVLSEKLSTSSDSEVK